MTEGVVDRLEAIEIEAEECETGAAAPGAGDFLLQAFLEMKAVSANPSAHRAGPGGRAGLLPPCGGRCRAQRRRSPTACSRRPCGRGRTSPRPRPSGRRGVDSAAGSSRSRCGRGRSLQAGRRTHRHHRGGRSRGAVSRRGPLARSRGVLGTPARRSAVFRRGRRAQPCRWCCRRAVDSSPHALSQEPFCLMKLQLGGDDPGEGLQLPALPVSERARHAIHHAQAADLQARSHFEWSAGVEADALLTLDEEAVSEPWIARGILDDEELVRHHRVSAERYAPRRAREVDAAACLEPLVGLADEGHQGDGRLEEVARRFTERVELLLRLSIENVEIVKGRGGRLRADAQVPSGTPNSRDWDARPASRRRVPPTVVLGDYGKPKCLVRSVGFPRTRRIQISAWRHSFARYLTKCASFPRLGPPGRSTRLTYLWLLPKKSK